MLPELVWLCQVRFYLVIWLDYNVHIKRRSQPEASWLKDAEEEEEIFLS